MAEEILTDWMRDALVQRMRELQPWMKTDVVHSLVAKCSEILEEGVQAQQQAIEQTKARTSFLSLSPELRNRIYELVVIAPDTGVKEFEQGTHRIENVGAIQLSPHYNYSNWDEVDPKATHYESAWVWQPPLTRVCRLIRKEALPIYYGSNEFVTEVDDRLTHPPWINEIRAPHVFRWLRGIGPENRQLLRTLTIRVVCSETRWFSTTRFLALARREGIDLPANVAASLYRTELRTEERYPKIIAVFWNVGTPEQEAEHSNFGDEPHRWQNV